MRMPRAISGHLGGSKYSISIRVPRLQPVVVVTIAGLDQCRLMQTVIGDNVMIGADADVRSFGTEVTIGEKELRANGNCRGTRVDRRHSTEGAVVGSFNCGRRITQLLVCVSGLVNKSESGNVKH